MEYYDYKEINNSTGNDSLDQVIIITVASSLSGIFGFILFCCCCTAGFAGWIDNCINNTLSGSDEEYGQRALRRMEEEKEKKKEDPEVRKEKLLKSFVRNNVSMVVSEHSFVKELDAAKGDDEALTDSTSSTGSTISEHGVDDDDSTHNQMDVDGDDEENQISNDTVIKNVSKVVEDIESGEPKELCLPPLTSEKGELISRKIPNCCAVCLCSYDVGDTIIWSSNKGCQHAFHEECILPWLIKNQTGECPCCRSPFTDLPTPDGTNNGNGSPSFWSIRTWMNRIRYTFLGQTEE